MDNLTSGTKLHNNKVSPYLDSYKGPMVLKTFSEGTDADHM